MRVRASTSHGSTLRAACQLLVRALLLLPVVALLLAVGAPAGADSTTPAPFASDGFNRPDANPVSSSWTLGERFQVRMLAGRSTSHSASTIGAMD